MVCFARPGEKVGDLKKHVPIQHPGLLPPEFAANPLHTTFCGLLMAKKLVTLS